MNSIIMEIGNQQFELFVNRYVESKRTTQKGKAAKTFAGSTPPIIEEISVFDIWVTVSGRTTE